MSIFRHLFKGTVRKTLAQMVSDTNIIQAAVCVKLSSSYKTKYGKDRGLTIAAAVTNKLFGKISPMHSEEDLRLAEQLAADILKTDSEVRYAALMSCRAILLFEAERDTEEKWVVWDTIQWMASIWNLAPDEANPTMIRQLASTLQNKYLRKERF
jgi:hypothetical protein